MATNRNERDLLDYILVLVKWRRMLIIGTLVAAVVVVAVSFVLPERWTARTSLLPPEEEGGSLGMSLLGGSGSGIPPGLAGLIGASTPSERLLTLLDRAGVPVETAGSREAPAVRNQTRPS